MSIYIHEQFNHIKRQFLNSITILRFDHRYRYYIVFTTHSILLTALAIIDQRLPNIMMTYFIPIILLY